jgi:hypothetical protein
VRRAAAAGVTVTLLGLQFLHLLFGVYEVHIHPIDHSLWAASTMPTAAAAAAGGAWASSAGAGENQKAQGLPRSLIRQKHLPVGGYQMHIQPVDHSLW